MKKNKYNMCNTKKSKIKRTKKNGVEWRKQKAVDWLRKNKGDAVAEAFILKQSPKSQSIIRNRVLKTMEIAPATKFAPALKMQVLRNSPPSVTLASDSRHQKFYCTVCKMKTWTFHEHDGRNTSSTIKHVKVSGDSTNISK